MLYLMRGLARRGVHQRLLARRGGPLARRVAAEGLPVDAVRVRGGLDPVGMVHLARLVRGSGHELVHAHDGRAHGLLVATRPWLGGRRRPRLVVSRRVDFSLGRHPPRWLGRWKFRVGADVVLCVSEAVRRVLLGDGLPPGRLRVVHDGVDPARLHQAPSEMVALRAALDLSEDARVVGAVGALVDHKAHDVLVDAAPALLAAHPEAVILVAGTGPRREALEARARQRGVGSRVRFLGHRDDMAALHALFEVFVHPSRMEGLGTSLLDAMALGTPVVASAAGGIPEAVRHEREGLLVVPEDADALAAAIVRVLDEPAAARAWGQAAAARIAGAFGVDAMVEGTLAAYEDVLAEPPPSAAATA